MSFLMAVHVLAATCILYTSLIHYVCTLPVYGKEVEKDVISDTSGHFKRLMVSMLTVRRLSTI